MNSSEATKLVLHLLLLLLVIIGLYYAHGQVKNMQVRYAAALAEVERGPVRITEISRQRADLERYHFDINRVDALLVNRSEIVSVVSAIEQEASEYGLHIEIPEIQEVQEVDESGNPISKSDPAVGVRIRIVTEGPPSDLVSFSHAVEHLPYLLLMDSWTLTNNERRVQSSPTEEEASPDIPLQPARLDMAVVLFVLQDIKDEQE